MTGKITGLVLPTVDNSFFSDIASHLTHDFGEAGYQTIILSSENDAQKEKEALQELTALNVEGIICISGLSEFPDDLVPDRIPLVFVDRIPKSEKPIPWVANDDADAMERAVHFLLDKGSRHILLLPGFLAEYHDNPRVNGYRKALEDRGLPFDPAYVLNRKGEGPTEMETAELVRKALASDLPVDGIIASSDRAAFGAIRSLQSVGYFVPEDIRLLSFDNSPYAAMASPSVTSLDRRPQELARKACGVLTGMMEGRQGVPIENVIPVSFAERDTTR